MRAACLLFALSFVGCINLPTASRPARVVSRTEQRREIRSPARGYTASSQPTEGLHLRYRGDTDHRIVQLTIVTPGVQRLDGRSDYSMWPLVDVLYFVPPGTSTVLLQGMSYWPHQVGLMACRSSFTVMSASWNGQPVSVTERITPGACLLEITLPAPVPHVTVERRPVQPRGQAFPPPVTSNGNGMWGTRNGPPVDPIDDTLP